VVNTSKSDGNDAENLNITLDFSKVRTDNRCASAPVFPTLASLPRALSAPYRLSGCTATSAEAFARPSLDPTLEHLSLLSPSPMSSH
jgi:hypothetical protein